MNIIIIMVMRKLNEDGGKKRMFNHIMRKEVRNKNLQKEMERF